MMRSPRDLLDSNMTYSLAAAAAAVDQNKTQHPAHQKGIQSRRANDPNRSPAPDVFGSPRWNAGPIVCLCGLLYRLLLERRTLPGNVWGWGLSGGWYLLDDDAIELDDPLGWQPLTDACARFENETGLVTLEPVLP
jgi:hypothetical protein